MADWYVSSAAWTAIPLFAVSTAYTVGQIVRPLTAPAFNSQYAFRCTTAGTSASTEPAWTGAPSNGSTVTSGGATFTNVSGQSTYGWSAAAGNLYSIGGNGAGGARSAVGDRVFLSSDHSESSATAQVYTPIAGSGFGVIQTISVNRAGSVPPVAADALSGAAIAYTGSNLWYLDSQCNQYWQGVTFTSGGTSPGIAFGNGGQKTHYFKNCALVLTTSSAGAAIQTANATRVVFDNTTVQFSNAGHHFQLNAGGASLEVIWINTPAAMLGTVPTVLFSAQSSSASGIMTCRGVDLSAVTTTLCYTANFSSFLKVLFDSCRIASGAARLGTAATGNTSDDIELVNCYDGTNFISERHTPAGDVTTEFAITLLGGATDNVGTFSHKLVSSTRSDKYAMTLDGFWMDLNVATIGGARTATVEIVGSGSLNNDDITLLIEYQGTSGTSRTSFVSSFQNPLTTPAALPTSTATWSSLPATPVLQRLQATFTPQVVGRVRAQVRLGKPSTTVYYNPQVTIS